MGEVAAWDADDEAEVRVLARDLALSPRLPLPDKVAVKKLDMAACERYAPPVCGLGACVKEMLVGENGQGARCKEVGAGVTRPQGEMSRRGWKGAEPKEVCGMN